MLYELAPRQAREHSCDPVGAVEFLYDSGYKYVQEALWRTEGKSDMQVGFRMRVSFSGFANAVGKAGLSECARAYVHACMFASVLVCTFACRPLLVVGGSICLLPSLCRALGMHSRAITSLSPPAILCVALLLRVAGRSPAKTCCG